MKHPIAQTGSGSQVYVDLIHSPAATHIASQPRLIELVKEVLASASIKGEQTSIEHDMGRLIGYDYVVETGDSDTIVYAKLIRSTSYSRFVKNGKPKASRYLTILLIRDDDGNYSLHDTWVGRKNPPLPGSEQETDDSKLYWSSHAFVLDAHQVQSSSITKVCPY